MGSVQVERSRARLAGWLLVGAALGAALVFAVRVQSLSTCWRGTITEGRESPGLYALWRLVHGHRLYEWPDRPPYSITFYNFGFYESYAAVLRVLGVDGEGLLAVSRLLTLLCSTVGCVLFVRVAGRLGKPSGPLLRTALAGLAFVVWFGTQFVSWWALAVRPDVGAAALALAGLGVVLDALRSERVPVARLVAASLLFFAAWSFKQSCVWTFASLVLGLLLLRRRVEALCLAGPWAMLVMSSLVVGGELYRYNILTAPAASAFRIGLLVENLKRTLPQNLWIFGYPLSVAFLNRRQFREWFRALPEADRLVLGAALLATSLGTLALGREGSNKNHLFEGYVLAALASWSALVREKGALVRPAVERGLALLLLPTVGMPFVQLLGVSGTGRVVQCTPSQRAELSELATAVAALPKPLYAEDEVLSLPWNSTDNRYPALVVDSTWYGIAEREGLVPPHLFRRLMASGRFRSAVLVDGYPELDGLRAEGVPCRPLAGTALGLHFFACSLSGGGSP